MDALLASVLTAHGGLDRWSGVKTLTVRLSLGGPFWGWKGWPDVLIDETIEPDAQREHLVYTPFTAPDRRASFAGYDRSTRRDAVQVAYFSSYALWNYLTTPFLFTYPGVQAHEIEPWQVEGQTWRRLHVTFPNTVATHNPEQTFYYDADGMQRRMDYIVEVNGNAVIAHYTSDPQTFGGFVFPTRRLVYRRHPDGTADRSLASITIDIHDVTINAREETQT